MYDIAKLIHVVAAILWIGGGVMITIYNARLWNAKDVQGLRSVNDVASSLGKAYFMPLAIVTLIAGIVMVLDTDAIAFSDAWISIGFAGIILTALIGPLRIEPAAERLAESIQANGIEAQETVAIQQQVRMWSMIDLVILLVVTWAMIYRPG